MADKQPVQDKLSKLLAELLWCLSASEEDDEYAGNEYFKESEGHDLDAAIPDEDVEMEIIEQGTDGEYDLMGAIDEESESEDAEEDSDSAAEEPTEEERIEALTYKHCQGAHLVVLFISTFLQTVRREWGNVDKHRIDKFYTAVRMMISEVRQIYCHKFCPKLGSIPPPPTQPACFSTPKGLSIPGQAKLELGYRSIIQRHTLRGRSVG